MPENGMTLQSEGTINLWGRKVVFLDGIYDGTQQRTRILYTKFRGSGLFILIVEENDKDGFESMSLMRKLKILS